MDRSPFTRFFAVLCALALIGLAAGPRAFAYPSSTPNAAWPTAKVDAQLKPHFGDLIGLRHHWRYDRPGWSRWRRFSWNGDCSGYNSGAPGCEYPCDPSDPYCAAAGYGGQCDPRDLYCQPNSGYPTYPCDPNTYCDGGGYPPAWAPGSDPYALPPAPVYGGGLEHVTVDCRAERPGRLSEALVEVADGGVIHLKGKGPACAGTLQIGKPVIIQGDPPSAFPTEPDAGPAVITASPGAPCAVIDAGPRAGVEFRDVVIEASDGGRSACIQTFSSAVALVRATVHYNGESSALYIQGGRLVLNDTEIDSGGLDAAIWAEDAAIGMRNVGISSASSGLDVKPGVGQTISLDHVSITSTPGGPSGGSAMSGLIGRRARAGDCAFVIANSYIAGFRTGLLFEQGLKVDVNHSRIDQSRMGIAVDGGVLSMQGSVVDATEYGVYLYSGRADITGGFVTSVLREPFGGDPGAVLHITGVAVYSDGCLHYGRHEGWLCHARHEGPAWLFRKVDVAARRWGWNG